MCRRLTVVSQQGAKPDVSSSSYQKATTIHDQPDRQSEIDSWKQLYAASQKQVERLEAQAERFQAQLAETCRIHETQVTGLRTTIHDLEEKVSKSLHALTTLV